MSGPTAGPVRAGGNVDERVLGAGTGLRFVLLLVLFLTSSATVASMIADSVVDPHHYGVGCALAAGLNPDDDYLGITLSTVRAGDAYRACLDRFVPSASMWTPLVVLGALVVAAVALYWLLPSWKGRRSRVVPVDAVDGQGELRALLDELVTVAGLPRAPRFVIAPAASTASAVVFGRLRRYSVCLHGGLVARRRSDPEGFRAVVLHELAHIRNRDVDITYATVAVWRVFLVTVLPAYLVWAALDLKASRASTVLGPAERLGTGHNLVLSAVMIAFVYLARSDILRTRETYADLDALAGGADAGSWLRGVHQHTQPGRARKAFASFAALWRTHPPWDRRAASLADTRELFRPHALTLFVAGATATIAADQTSSLLRTYDVGWAVRPLAGLLAGLIAAIPGVALWRAVARAVLTGDRVPSGLRVGWWLGVGLAVGELLTSNTSGSTRLLPSHPEVFAVLIVLAVGTMGWTAQYAELSVRSWQGRTLRPALLIGLAATWAVFALWYAWWQTEGQIFVLGSAFSESGIRQALERDLPGSVPGHQGALSAIAVALPVLLPLGTDPLVMWAAAVLWLLPLLVWARRPATSAPEWARRALRDVPEIPLGGERPPSLRRILAVAGIGTLVCWSGAAGVMAYMHTWQPPVDRRFGTYLLVFLAWLLIAVTCGSVAAAVLAAVVVRRLPLLAALVAAGTAALFGLAGVFLLGSSDGCLGPLNTLGSTCHWLPMRIWPSIEVLLPLVLGLGIFASAGSALLALGVKRALRPLRQTAARAAGQVETAGRDRLVTRRLWVAAICLAVVVLSTAVSLPSGAEPTTRTSLTRNQLVPGAAIGPVSPQVLSLQTDAWLRLGGMDLAVRFHGDLLEILTALEDDAALTDRDFAATRIRPGCRDVAQVADGFHAYFPVPDPQARQRWERLLAQADRAAADCQRAIDDGDYSLFVSSMNTFVDVSGSTPDVFRSIRGR
ncbi:M48 family metalloprotease [Planosporangium thailandense]|uniref:M48 family metalloprotease n=1 Tax=Planosporangium thailandense TaxID=765197 RepID=A0ABX0XX52_9ACTN|nr:M48 family metalloprotease [Planosporangium thailandense]NJC70621.1 M48 family metalloprotease [Planosporangium thailandense]